jgi:cell migration-inducing and hyaluronan-binding protein
VIFELPEFTTAAECLQQGSLDALKDASETSYFKDGDTLWVKLVVADAAGSFVLDGPGGPGGGGPGGATRIEVSR